VNGKVHHFSAGGLYNGLVLLIDDETGTYWDHITGEAVHGPLAGSKLETWGIQMSTAGAVKAEDPDLILHRSRQSLRERATSWFFGLPFMKGKLPPGFRDTMSAVDTRLPEMSIGLGVVADGAQRFYQLSEIGSGIDDEIDGRRVHIQIGEDSVPSATWSDGTRPLQLFSRWYGFSLTYPRCEVHAVGSAGASPGVALAG